MDAHFAQRLRSLFRWTHTWLGITLGFVVAVTCLTGSIAVFRQQDRPFRATGPSGPISLDRAAAIVEQFAAGSHVTRVRFPLVQEDPYIFTVKPANDRTRRVAFDGASEAILGMLPAVSWMDWVIDLHRNLLEGPTGRALVGVVGLLTLVLSLTALVLWLLSGAGSGALFRIRKGAPRRFWFETHRVTGLWAMCFVAMISASGIVLAFSDTTRSAWEYVTGGPASMHAPQVDSSERVAFSLDQYMDAARAAMPDGEATELRIPQSPGDAVQLRFRRASDFAPTGVNRIYLDPASRNVLSLNLASNWPLGMRLYQSISPVHYADFGGPGIKVLWAVLGFAPSVLFVTGLWFWLLGRRKVRRPAQSTRSEVEIPLAVGR